MAYRWLERIDNNNMEMSKETLEKLLEEKINNMRNNPYYSNEPLEMRLNVFNWNRLICESCNVWKIKDKFFYHSKVDGIKVYLYRNSCWNDDTLMKHWMEEVVIKGLKYVPTY